MNRREPLWARLERSGLPLLLARLVLGAVLVWTGLAKLAAPVTFLKLLKQYDALPLEPPYWMNGAALVVPWLEVVVGAALLLGLAVRGAGVLAAVLLLVFTPLIWLRGMELYNQGGFATFCAVRFDCGCGGGVVQVCNKLLENLGLLLLALVAARSRSRRFCLSRLLVRRGAASRPRVSAE